MGAPSADADDEPEPRSSAVSPPRDIATVKETIGNPLHRELTHKGTAMRFDTVITRTTGALVATTASVGAAVTGATTATAGALGGGAVGAGLGAIRGAGEGIVDGAQKGSRSTPAAALTAVVLGAAGIVDWPLLLAAGGTALLVARLTRHPDTPTPPRPSTTPPVTKSGRTTATKTPRSAPSRAAARRRPPATPAAATPIPTPTPGSTSGSASGSAGEE